METQLGCADPTESTHSEFCRVAKMRMRTGGNDRVSGDYERSGHHGSPAIFSGLDLGFFLIPGTGTVGEILQAGILYNLGFFWKPGICLEIFVRFSKIFRRAWGAVMYSESVRKIK